LYAINRTVMSIAALTFIALFIFLIPKRQKSFFQLLLVIALTLLSGIPAVNVLFNDQTFNETLPVTFWNQTIALSLDNLSALFVLIINFTMLTGSVYAIQYIRQYQNKSATELSLHFFSFYLLHLSMVLVCMLQNIFAFMVVWELMAVSSFLLVIFENEKESVIRAGINYFVQMHIGAIFLMIAFLVLYINSGSLEFTGLKIYFYEHNPLLLLFLFFVGFGIKAGFFPLHTWLPHAHPAAPSHVSAVMSGVMIKLGIYGILRVLIHVQSDLVAIGIFMLIISVLSGLGGVGVAIVQHDLKRLLAFHSIENIGIIGIGIGLGLIGSGLKNPVLVLFGFSGALLHIFNHSLFKSLLFFTSGTVYQKTHTRDLNLLGGLAKKMPQTTALFLLAALAICGLPPFNGFISEYLIYIGLIKGLIGAGVMIKILLMLTLLGLTLIGGLAIFCFTKAFGVVFLGNPRHKYGGEFKDTTWYSLFPQYIIGAIIICIGIFPAFFLLPFTKVAAQFFPANIAFPVSTLFNLQQISFTGLIFIILVTLIYGIKVWVNHHRRVEVHPTWGCGYNGLADKMQYTASSFAENYTDVAKSVTNIREMYHPIAETEIFPAVRSFETKSKDLIEEKLNNPLVKQLERWLKRLAFVQTGHTQHYILFAFVLLVVLILLTVFNLI